MPKASNMSSTLLTCSIHKRRNIEKKLKEMGSSAEAQRPITDDVLESAEKTPCMKVLLTHVMPVSLTRN